MTFSVSSSGGWNELAVLAPFVPDHLDWRRGRPVQRGLTDPFHNLQHNLPDHEHRHHCPSHRPRGRRAVRGTRDTAHLPGAHRGIHGRRQEREADPGGAAAPGHRPGAFHRHVVLRGPEARHAGRRHGRPDHGAGGRGDPRPDLQRDGRPGGQPRTRVVHEKVPDPPSGPGPCRPGHQGRHPRDRHQGRGPHLPLHQGRQGGRLRRRRRGQDGRHHGADQQHRQGARRLFRFRRGGRAFARGQRPLPRDVRGRRHRPEGPEQVQGRARLRPDERAPGRPHASGAGRPRDDRVFPRREEPGRPSLHRQHFPVLPGRLRGLGAARALAFRGGLPADAGQRDGASPGAHHVDEEGFHHLLPGRLRARRRPHGPRAGQHLRPPRFDHRAGAFDCGTRNLPGRRSARLRLQRPHRGDRRRGALPRGPRGAARAAALQGPAGHHRHPGPRRALARGQDHGLPRPQDPALPLPAVQRRRGLHRHAGQVRFRQGDRPRLQDDPRRTARRHGRGRFLHEGRDRRGHRHNEEVSRAHAPEP